MARRAQPVVDTETHEFAARLIIIVRGGGNENETIREKRTKNAYVGNEIVLSRGPHRYLLSN